MGPTVEERVLATRGGSLALGVGASNAPTFAERVAALRERAAAILAELERLAGLVD